MAHGLAKIRAADGSTRASSPGSGIHGSTPAPLHSNLKTILQAEYGAAGAELRISQRNAACVSISRAGTWTDHDHHHAERIRTRPIRRQQHRRQHTGEHRMDGDCNRFLFCLQQTGGGEFRYQVDRRMDDRNTDDNKDLAR